MYKPIFNNRSVLKFKHFTNKGYSVFSWLAKEFTIGTLSVATLSHATASGLSTRVDLVTTDSTRTNRAVMLEEVSVMGTRAPLTQSQQARMVTVLSRDDIQAAPVQSINDLLKQTVGIDVRQRGPIGAQTDVSVRGSTCEQITVLLNGINICDPQTGHNTFDFPVDISDIERIEVLEGPAARVYGTSSLVGAINIVTKTSAHHDEKRGKPWDVSARAEGGSYGYFTFGTRVGHTASHFSNSLSGSFTRSDGYSRSRAGNLNADYDGGKAFYQGAFDNDAVHIQWHAGLFGKTYGSNTFYGVSSDEQLEHIFKSFTAVQASTKRGKLHFKPALYWNRTNDRFEYFRGQPDRVKYNYHETNVYGASLNSYLDWSLGRTAFGVEVRNEDLISTNLGEPLGRRHTISGTDRFYECGLNRTNLSLVFEHNILLNRFTLSAGVLAVNNSWADMGMRFYPGIDASYQLGNGWKVYASYNTSLRMPSVTELYYSVEGYRADSHLKPEELSAVEMGVKYLDRGVNGKLSVYYNHYKNLIDWIRHTNEGADAPWQSVNFGRINAVGVEMGVDLNLHSLFPSQQVMRRLQFAYSYIHQNHAEENHVQSRYALEYLRNKLVAGLQLRLWRQLELSVNYRLQDRTGNYTDRDGNVCDYATYGIVDSRLSWQTTHYRFFLDVNNLFDSTYIDVGNVPQPGLWVMAGVSCRW